MLTINVYSSEACCLCDDAVQLLAESSVSAQLRINKVDIYRDKSLLIKYATSIPVLQCLIPDLDKTHADGHSAQAILKWPFTGAELEQWLKAYL